MNQWAFVMAAYGLVGCATAGLIMRAWRLMRSAEADAEAAKRRQ
ncbi:MAG TPA: hypothetical protein VFO12_08535 [Sphingomicrobium sp.]|nr:hypothetical protein [Sphingomicrobium sp.]